MTVAQPAASRRLPGPLERFAALTGTGDVLMMTARFGRSPVRDAAYRLRAQHRDLDLKPSWRVFNSLDDWGERWVAERESFAGGLILSAVGDPVVERAVGRCMADLASLGRPLLWGVVSAGIRWYPRFTMSANGWRPEELSPHPAAYARLHVAHDGTEFRPQFDSVLYAADPDFSVSNSHLRWSDARRFYVLIRKGGAS